MKLHNFVVTVTLLASSISSAWGAEHAGRVSVYMSPQDYRHDVRLNNFYYDYWINKAEIVEPVALEALRSLFADAGVCQGGEAADVVVSIKPYIFYNPHMTTFYGEIEAQTYSGSGKHLATYRADAQTVGALDIQPAVRVQAVYQDAMRNIVSQMQADGAVMALANNGLPEAQTKMPCEMVSVLKPNNN